MLASFAAQLVGAGVPQVLAMQAPVTDPYATRAERGVLPAAGHRRLPRPAAGPGRGAAGGRAGPAGTAAGLAAARPGGVGHPGAGHPGAAAAAVRPARAVRAGAAAAGPGAGRGRGGPRGRGLRRAPPGDAPGPPGAGRDGKAGLVLHGIGGVGKSTLAAEVLRSLGEDAGLVVSRAGQVSVDDVLGEVGARLHHGRIAAEGGEGLARAALELRAADVEWADRWRLLAEQILPACR